MIRLKVFSFSCAAIVALLALVSPAFATAVLEPVDTLPSSMPEKSTVTYRLRYMNPNGDRILHAIMTDRSASGSTAIQVTTIPTDDTSKGTILEWTIKNPEPGTHHADFKVETAAETTRYPTADSDTYDFVVEQMMVKWSILAGGVLVGILFLPFMFYQISRSMNQRGDPSRAARVALMLGVLGCGALFIYLFAGTFGILGIAIAALVALGLIVTVLTKR